MEQKDNKETVLCMAFKLYEPPARIQNTWPIPRLLFMRNLKTIPNVDDLTLRRIKGAV